MFIRCLTSENETLALRNENEKLNQQLEQLNAALHELGRENQSLQVGAVSIKASVTYPLANIHTSFLS